MSAPAVLREAPRFSPQSMQGGGVQAAPSHRATHTLCPQTAAIPVGNTPCSMLPGNGSSEQTLLPLACYERGEKWEDAPLNPAVAVLRVAGLWGHSRGAADPSSSCLERGGSCHLERGSGVEAEQYGGRKFGEKVSRAGGHLHQAGGICRDNTLQSPS